MKIPNMHIETFVTGRLKALIPTYEVPQNPIKLIRLLNLKQSLFFLTAFSAWTLSAFGFFVVSLNIRSIVNSYDASTIDITWTITVTLMCRCIGAFLFGIAGDRCSRKWTFIVNIILYAIAGIISGFCQTYAQFLITRAFYGIAMGGIYGNSAAIALEDAPIAARGLLSGLLQQGYTLGSLLASVLNPIIVNNQSYGWRAVFWVVSSLALVVAVCHVFLPETEAFALIKQIREQKRPDKNQNQDSKWKLFDVASLSLIRSHWVLLIYLVCVTSGFGFLTHGSQDMYPSFLKDQLHFSDALTTTILTIAYSAAFIGGMMVGYCSTFFGRRLTMITFLIIGATLIPAYILPRNATIIIGASLEQVCIEGAYGIVPIYLLELAPFQCRSFVIGTVYELGNLVAALSPTIVAALARCFPLPSSQDRIDTDNFDYGKAIGILLSIVYAFMIPLILLGPEKRNIDELHTTSNTHEERNCNIAYEAPEVLEKSYLLAKSDHESN